LVQQQLVDTIGELAGGMAEVLRVQQVHAEQAEMLRHGGLATAAMVDFRRQEHVDCFAYITDARLASGSRFSGASASDPRSAYKQSTERKGGQHLVPKWRRFYEAVIEKYGRCEITITDTFICEVVESIMISESDAVQLLSAVKTVIEMGPCKNLALDGRRRKHVIKIAKRLKASRPRYTVAFETELPFQQIVNRNGKSLEQRTPSHLLEDFVYLFTTHTLCRGADLAKWDWRDHRRPQDPDGEYCLVLWDIDGKVLGLENVQQAVRAQVRFVGSKMDDEREYSSAVEFRRINYDLLLDTSVPHRASKAALQKLDVFEYLRVLYARHFARLRWVEIGSTVCDMTQKFMAAPTTECVSGTTASGINKMKQRLLKNSGVSYSTADHESEVAGAKKKHLYGGHAVRGNAGSILDAVHRLGVVNYPADEHVVRARHSLAVFESNYKRTPPARVLDYMRRLAPDVAQQYSADDVLFV
jgi:hypothetical protein